MKTKFIKVSTADRLPGEYKTVKVVDQEDNIYDGFITDKKVWQVYTQFEYGRIEYWLEEKSDHEEEMREMLVKSVREISGLRRLLTGHPECKDGSEFDDFASSAWKLENEIEAILGKIK